MGAARSTMRKFSTERYDGVILEPSCPSTYFQRDKIFKNPPIQFPYRRLIKKKIPKMYKTLFRIDRAIYWKKLMNRASFRSAQLRSIRDFDFNNMYLFVCFVLLFFFKSTRAHIRLLNRLLAIQFYRLGHYFPLGCRLLSTFTSGFEQSSPTNQTYLSRFPVCAWLHAALSFSSFLQRYS